MCAFEFIVFASLIFLGEVFCQNREKKKKSEMFFGVSNCQTLKRRN
jgi:hypothetical protein